MENSIHRPGEECRKSGTYTIIDKAGTPIGEERVVAEGEPFPSTPQQGQMYLLKDSSGDFDQPEINEYQVTRESNLSEGETKRISEIQKEINEFYDRIPTELQATPEIQNRCLSYLLEAERILARRPLHRSDIIESKLAVTRVNIELTRAHISRRSFMVVAVLVYIAGALVFLAFQFGILRSATPEALNEDVVFGIPLPVWIWSIVGSITSMLLRAGQFPFADIGEAVRWLLFRPIVGVVMGVLTYLMVVAGLIVFAGTSSTETPELIWVIAFVGSFSDTLSINLLNRMLGQFKPVEGTSKEVSRETIRKHTDEQSMDNSA